jgi:hypothetical protein
VPGVLSPGLKRPEREDDHSPAASAEVKKMWIHGIMINYLSTWTNLPFLSVHFQTALAAETHLAEGQ